MKKRLLVTTLSLIIIFLSFMTILFFITENLIKNKEKDYLKYEVDLEANIIDTFYFNKNLSKKDVVNFIKNHRLILNKKSPFIIWDNNEKKIILNPLNPELENKRADINEDLNKIYNLIYKSSSEGTRFIEISKVEKYCELSNTIFYAKIIPKYNWTISSFINKSDIIYNTLEFYSIIGSLSSLILIISSIFFIVNAKRRKDLIKKDNFILKYQIIENSRLHNKIFNSLDYSVAYCELKKKNDVVIDCNILEANNTFYKMFNLKNNANEDINEEMNQYNWFKLFNNSIKNNSKLDFDYYSKRLQKWIKVVSHPIELNKVIVSVEDVTNKKIREDELLNLAKFPEENPSPIIRVTIDGYISYINKSAKDKLKALNFDLGTKLNDTWFDYLVETISAKKNIQKEIKINGSIYLFTFSASENSSYINIYSSDITELIKTRDKNKELERELSRTRKLDAVGKFSVGIAHDFKNIITSINGLAEILLNLTDEEDSRREYLEDIKKSCSKGTNFIKNLFSLSINDNSTTKKIDINSVIKDNIKILRNLVGKDVKIILNINSKNKIESNESQIEQILLNCLANARDSIKKIKNSNGKILIETSDVIINKKYKTLKAGKYVLLSVIDNGAGIADEIKDYIFDPFFTTKEDEKDIGMGLSTVYSIIKKNSGYIFVSNNKKGGAKFDIYWPTNDKNEITKTNYGKILVVDDDEQILNIIKRFLKKLKYDSLCASSGAEAIEKAENESISLMIADVRLGDMNSYQLIDELNKRKIKIKTIFMSAYPFNNQLEDKYMLKKPFSIKKLSEKIKKVLNS